MTPFAWGVATALSSAGCGAAGQETGQGDLVTILLAVIPAVAGVGAAWVASGRGGRRRRRDT